MPEEEKIEIQQEELMDLGAELNKLKQTTVSLDEYNKVVKERNLYASNLINGVNNEPELVDTRTSADIRKELFNGREKSNLEYCSLAVDLRDKVLEESGEDIFVAKNSIYTPTAESYAAAERVASVMKECIDYANGDSNIFTQELMRRTNDVKMPTRK